MKDVRLIRPPTRLLGRLVLATGLLLTGITQVNAGGTTAGTLVGNMATLTFDVGAASYTLESTSAGNTTLGAGNGADTNFTVDNRIDLTVAEVNATYGVAGATTTSPGATAAVISFTVTNDGNAIQDYALSAANNASDPFGGTENFDPSSWNIYVDANGNGTYDAGTDTADYINELAADASITVFVVSVIPAGVSDGNIAAVTLTAATRIGETATHIGNADSGTLGAVITPDNGNADNDDGTNNPGANVDDIFADGTGDTDADNDGAHSDTDAYLVASAQITVSKTTGLVCDPVSGTTNPHHIPLAYVYYDVTIANDAAATASATLTQISDTLSGNLAIDTDLITGAGGAAGCAPDPAGTAESAAGRGFKVTCAGTTRAAGVGASSTSCSAGAYFTTASDADGVEHNAGAITATMSTVLPAEAGPGYAAGELKPGESVTLRFNAVIQ